MQVASKRIGCKPKFPCVPCSSWSLISAFVQASGSFHGIVEGYDVHGMDGMGEAQYNAWDGARMALHIPSTHNAPDVPGTVASKIQQSNLPAYASFEGGRVWHMLRDRIVQCFQARACNTCYLDLQGTQLRPTRGWDGEKKYLEMVQCASYPDN